MPELGGEEMGAEGGAPAAAGGEEEMVVVEPQGPGNRDEDWYKIRKGKKTLTNRSKGNWYEPTGERKDKRRHMAPRKKSFEKLYSKSLASSSRKNIAPELNNVLNPFKSISKGIYEDKEPIYSLDESVILNSNDEVERLISQLETKEDENK